MCIPLSGQRLKLIYMTAIIHIMLRYSNKVKLGLCMDSEATSNSLLTTGHKLERQMTSKHYESVPPILFFDLLLALFSFIE